MDPSVPDPATLLAGLHDIRLPAQAAGGAAADILAAVGFGLLLALCLSPAVRALTRTGRRGGEAGLAARLAEIERLPEAQRQSALLRVVGEVKPEYLRRKGADLYRRGGLPSAADLAAALRGAG